MNDVVVDVAQQERSNNKCYASVFSNLQIQIKWVEEESKYKKEEESIMEK